MRLTIEETKRLLIERLEQVGKYQGTIRGVPTYTNPKGLIDEIMYDLRELQRMIEVNNAEAKK